MRLFVEVRPDRSFEWQEVVPIIGSIDARSDAQESGAGMNFKIKRLRSPFVEPELKLKHNSQFHHRFEDRPATMKSNIILILVMGALAQSLVDNASAVEKLKVFILAGQSNTVGHARGHTIATLYKTGKPRDAELARMVFNNGDVSTAFDEQIARAKELDKISGGIGFPVLKAMADGAEKTALEAQINKLVAEHKAYKEKVIDTCNVSDRVYITSIADRNTKSGKLGVGYGADELKLGPEYGFGLSMAQKVEGPILLIKASWGGKSLMYDFRPPSAPEFRSTKAYADAKAKAEENLARYKEAVKNFPEAEKKYAIDLAAYQEKMKTADEETKKKLREPRKPRPPREPKPFSQDDAGYFWRAMEKHVSEVLADPKKHHPAYDAEQGYEIAGFVWFQGFNDQFNPEYHANYAENMKTFIKDVRTTFKTPDLPFVIGVLGTNKTREKVDENEVARAQRKAAQASEFKGTVVAVESYTDYSHYSDKVFQKGWPQHYHEWDTVGSDRPYHYLGSGAFFVRLGDSFALAMAEMLKPSRTRPERVSEEAFESLKAGASKNQVLNFWGKPQRVEVEDGEELWFYRLQLKKAKPTRRGSTSTIPIMLEFKENRVAKKHRVIVD